jgi:hypothetical protein
MILKSEKYYCFGTNKQDMNARLEGYIQIQSNWETIRSEFYYEPDVIGEAFQNLTVAEESKQFT